MQQFKAYAFKVTFISKVGMLDNHTRHGDDMIGCDVVVQTSNVQQPIILGTVAACKLVLTNTEVSQIVIVQLADFLVVVHNDNLSLW